MTSKHSKELISNRQARHHYEIIESFETGIVLQGTEVKSLRENGGNIQESYIKIKNNELWLVGAHIAPYKQGNIYNHEELRERKLLMHKREIFRLKADLQEKGLTLIPLSLYLKQGKIKVQIATAKGKKAFDKREAIKTREEKRKMQKMLKDYS